MRNLNLLVSWQPQRQKTSLKSSQPFSTEKLTAIEGRRAPKQERIERETQLHQNQLWGNSRRRFGCGGSDIPACMGADFGFIAAHSSLRAWAGFGFMGEWRRGGFPKLYLLQIGVWNYHKYGSGGAMGCTGFRLLCSWKLGSVRDLLAWCVQHLFWSPGSRVVRQKMVMKECTDRCLQFVCSTAGFGWSSFVTDLKCCSLYQDFEAQRWTWGVLLMNRNPRRCLFHRNAVLLYPDQTWNAPTSSEGSCNCCSIRGRDN